MKRTFLIAFLSLFLVPVTACSVNKVASWERGNLARPVMVRDSSAHHAALEQHAYKSKESAQGGYSIGAGGCGCN